MSPGLIHRLDYSSLLSAAAAATCTRVRARLVYRWYDELEIASNKKETGTRAKDCWRASNFPGLIFNILNNERRNGKGTGEVPFPSRTLSLSSARVAALVLVRRANDEEERQQLRVTVFGFLRANGA